MRNYQFPNQETKLCVTIGHPVNKQKSLFMHNAGYEALGINFLYLVHDVAPERLAESVLALKELGVAGFSVSMPHKVGILKYIDLQTDAVKAIGACNTVHPEGGKLVGYNSDWIGAIECLKKKTELRNKKALVLGAGGAARGIVYGLKEEGAEVTVLNRDQHRAEEIGKHFNVKWGDINDTAKYNNYDIIVNATSVGTRKTEECDCFLCRFLKVSTSTNKTTAEALFQENKIALDVVFQRNTTEFTNAAVRKGNNVVYGHEMLVAQGAFQFKLFTGFEAPVEAMYAELKRNLEDW